MPRKNKPFKQPKNKLGHIVTVTDEHGVLWKLVSEPPDDDGRGPRICFYRCDDGRGWSIPWANVVNLAGPQELLKEIGYAP